MRQTRSFWVLLFFLLAGLFSACASASADPSSAVTNYLQALVERDLNRLINNSCAAWEADARLEYQSFEAVKATLENLSCQTAEEVEGYTLVKCTGLIQANYGAEVLTLDLSQRIFQVRQEQGQWRMCGYR